MNAVKTWILVGNASEAKIYESENIGREIHLIKEFDHPAGREKNVDLAADRDGHYQANNGMGYGG